MTKLKPDVLRTTERDEEKFKKIKRNPIYIILDNVLDTYNVGAIFRLADAIAAEEVILCGQTETPPNTRIKKASINTTEWVPWKYEQDILSAISNLKSQVPNIQIVAVEQDQKSVPFQEIEYSFPVAFVVGHETHGIQKEVLDLADKVVELPMYGINTSLNVMVSLGIILYQSLKFLP